MRDDERNKMLTLEKDKEILSVSEQATVAGVSKFLLFTFSVKFCLSNIKLLDTLQSVFVVRCVQVGAQNFFYNMWFHQKNLIFAIFLVFCVFQLASAVGKHIT